MEWLDRTKKNASRVTSMRSMFQNADSFEQDVNGWNVSRVVDLSSAFSVRQRSLRALELAHGRGGALELHRRAR